MPPFLHRLLRFDLHRLIMTLAILGVLATFGNSFYTVYQAQRQLLIANTLESNRVYAAKLAATAETMLTSAQGQLAYSASLLGPLMQANDKTALKAEIDRLRNQTNTFDDAIIVNAKSIIVATSPESPDIKGHTLTSRTARQTLVAKTPLLSDAFISPWLNNYLITLSYPVFSTERRYLGYVSGAIRLKSNNILSNVLGRHYYHDGSSLYVVDKNGALIYHPDPVRIGHRILNSPVINQVLNNNAGAQSVTTLMGAEMLVGFAPVTSAGWGVVVQRPLNATLAGLDELVINILLGMLPTTLGILFLIWLSATFISRPLRQLAKRACLMDQQGAFSNIAGIRAWYFEAAQLKQAILKGLGLLNTKIDKLHNDSHTDPMTGLFNRRGMQRLLDEYLLEPRPLCVIALDIDHFKRINDNFGHDVGDQVIVALAQLMQQEARSDAALCRSGGEEFLLLLPSVTLAQARGIAERLRLKVAGHEMETVGAITISLGVAHWPADREYPLDTVLKQADEALYEAKYRGRNCVMVPKEA